MTRFEKAQWAILARTMEYDPYSFERYTEATRKIFIIDNYCISTLN